MALCLGGGGLFFFCGGEGCGGVGVVECEESCKCC